MATAAGAAPAGGARDGANTPGLRWSRAQQGSDDPGSRKGSVPEADRGVGSRKPSVASSSQKVPWPDAQAPSRTPSLPGTGTAAPPARGESDYGLDRYPTLPASEPAATMSDGRAPTASDPAVTMTGYSGPAGGDADFGNSYKAVEWKAQNQSEYAQPLFSNRVHTADSSAREPFPTVEDSRDMVRLRQQSSFPPGIPVTTTVSVRESTDDLAALRSGGDAEPNAPPPQPRASAPRAAGAASPPQRRPPPNTPLRTDVSADLTNDDPSCSIAALGAFDGSVPDGWDIHPGDMTQDPAGAGVFAVNNDSINSTSKRAKHRPPSLLQVAPLREATDATEAIDSLARMLPPGTSPESSIGSPMSPAPLGVKSSNQPRAIPASNVISFLKLDTKRRNSITVLPTFLLFCILYSIGAMLNFNFGKHQAHVEIHDAIMEEALSQSLFREIVSSKDLFQWLSLASESLYSMPSERPGSLGSVVLGDIRAVEIGVDNSVWTVGSGAVTGEQNVLLHYLVLRQHRAKLSACSGRQAQMLNASTMPSQCVQEYSPGRLNGTRFGTSSAALQAYAGFTTDPFLSDGEKAELGQTMPRMGHVVGLENRRVYSDHDEQFTVLFPTGMNATEVNSVLHELSSLAWIDSATQMVCVEAIFFNPAREQYTLVRNLLEFEYSGMRSRTRSHADAFWVFHFDGSTMDQCLFALDCIFGLYLFFLIHELARQIYAGMKMKKAERRQKKVRQCCGCCCWMVLKPGHRGCCPRCLPAGAEPSGGGWKRYPTNNAGEGRRSSQRRRTLPVGVNQSTNGAEPAEAADPWRGWRRGQDHLPNRGRCACECCRCGGECFIGCKLAWASFAFWECLLVIQFSFLGIALYYRFTCWVKGDTLHSPLGAAELYNELTNYQEHFRSAKNWIAVTLFLTWARWLDFMRLDGRVSTVTETVRLGADALLGLFVTALILFFGFAYFGHLLYGWHINAFRSFSATLVWLMLQFCTASLEEYREMEELHPIMSPVYVALFFVLLWLVLLNVILGILAVGFSAASSTTTDAAWSLESISQQWGSTFEDDEEETKGICCCNWNCICKRRYQDDAAVIDFDPPSPMSKFLFAGGLVPSAAKVVGRNAKWIMRMNSYINWEKTEKGRDGKWLAAQRGASYDDDMTRDKGWFTYSQFIDRHGVKEGLNRWDTADKRPGVISATITEEGLERVLTTDPKTLWSMDWWMHGADDASGTTMRVFNGSSKQTPDSFSDSVEQIMNEKEELKLRLDSIHDDLHRHVTESGKRTRDDLAAMQTALREHIDRRMFMHMAAVAKKLQIVTEVLDRKIESTGSTLKAQVADESDRVAREVTDAQKEMTKQVGGVKSELDAQFRAVDEQVRSIQQSDDGLRALHEKVDEVAMTGMGTYPLTTAQLKMQATKQAAMKQLTGKSYGSMRGSPHGSMRRTPGVSPHGSMRRDPGVTGTFSESDIPGITGSPKGIGATHLGEMNTSMRARVRAASAVLVEPESSSAGPASTFGSMAALKKSGGSMPPHQLPRKASSRSPTPTSPPRSPPRASSVRARGDSRVATPQEQGAPPGAREIPAAPYWQPFGLPKPGQEPVSPTSPVVEQRSDGKQTLGTIGTDVTGIRSRSSTAADEKERSQLQMGGDGTKDGGGFHTVAQGVSPYVAAQRAGSLRQGPRGRGSEPPRSREGTQEPPPSTTSMRDPLAGSGWGNDSEQGWTTSFANDRPLKTSFAQLPWERGPGARREGTAGSGHAGMAVRRSSLSSQPRSGTGAHPPSPRRAAPSSRPPPLTSFPPRTRSGPQSGPSAPTPVAETPLSAPRTGDSPRTHPQSMGAPSNLTLAQSDAEDLGRTRPQSDPSDDGDMREPTSVIT